MPVLAQGAVRSRSSSARPEPFKKLVHQGIVLGEDNQKMSKSRGNVVNPDEMIDQFGADAVRLYEMFMGPLEAMKPWSTRGVEGVTRFLERVWRLMVNEEGRLSRRDRVLDRQSRASTDAPSDDQKGDGGYRGICGSIRRSRR